jgi:hypothetical protein
VKYNPGQTVCNYFIGKETGLPWYKKRRVKCMLVSQVKDKPDGDTSFVEHDFLVFKDEKRKFMSELLKFRQVI